MEPPNPNSHSRMHTESSRGQRGNNFSRLCRSKDKNHPGRSLFQYSPTVLLKTCFDVFYDVLCILVLCIDQKELQYTCHSRSLNLLFPNCWAQPSMELYSKPSPSNRDGKVCLQNSSHDIPLIEARCARCRGSEDQKPEFLKHGTVPKGAQLETKRLCLGQRQEMSKQAKFHWQTIAPTGLINAHK